MATSFILLPMAAAEPADGTGSGNTPPAYNVLVSSGTQPGNAPKVTFGEWLFDAATDEHIMWSFRTPEDYLSGGTLRLTFKPKTTQTGTNNIVIKSCLATVTSDNIDSKVFPVPDTLIIALANNQVAGVNSYGVLNYSTTALNAINAGDFVVLFVGRDADHASDTATGDMALVDALFNYTS